MGRLFSLHMQVAVRSITFRPRVQHFVVGDVVELRGCRVLLRVGGVDAVHTGTFQHDIRLNLDAAQTGPVSVVKNGLPVPADMMTTSPASIHSMARHLL